MSSEITIRKGKKRMKNQPALHDEIKTSRNVFLTPSSWNKVKACAKKYGISASELVEQWARNLDGD